MSDTAVGVARSYLYVPGDRPERFAKAIASGADAVILDLEDAVAVPAKDDARANVVEALATAAADTADAPATDLACELWVRVNQGDRGLLDLDAVVGLPGLTGVFVPKCTTAALERSMQHLGVTPTIALVESAHAVLELAALAGWPGVSGLAMGEVDLAADLAIDPGPEGDELWPIRLSAVVASVAHDLPAPIGPVWVDVRDLDGLERSTANLRRRGFSARQAIHPAQVPVINTAMSPTNEAIEDARDLLVSAAGEGNGVWVDANGRMVDEAVLRSARRIVEQADHWGLA